MDYCLDLFENPIYVIFIICLICVGIYCARIYVRGAVCMNDGRLDGKTVLITGANSGIGAATAEDMARRGARVIMACRNMFKAETVAFNIVERTGSKQIVVQHLDLASFDSIRKFAGRIKSQERRLDILINNAGVGVDPNRQTNEGLEFNFGVNYVGHFLLTTMLLDMLKKSAPSRIINVSSVMYKHGGRFEFDNLGAPGRFSTMKSYCQSKLANILFSKELGRRLAGTGVISMSLHPGVVWTNFFRDSSLWFWILTTISGPFFMKTSFEGAQTTIHCALLDATRQMIDGKSLYCSNCAEEILEPVAEIEEDARRLWEWTERFIAEHVEYDD